MMMLMILHSLEVINLLKVINTSQLEEALYFVIDDPFNMWMKKIMVVLVMKELNQLEKTVKDVSGMNVLKALVRNVMKIKVMHEDIKIFLSIYAFYVHYIILRVGQDGWMYTLPQTM
ncbi:MAG: hypothetical protein EZS28_040029 [Streblomastix strix]|uniref:Uncharacterized protein n=1 Tax=Streblomastix strix TaxID=222440 RepID=A0A5J4U239_9EUKA|nr:MAG: hypothetical protein EZS28_040029 [Streblomastix strix]